MALLLPCTAVTTGSNNAKARGLDQTAEEFQAKLEAKGCRVSLLSNSTTVLSLVPLHPAATVACCFLLSCCCRWMCTSILRCKLLLYFRFSRPPQKRITFAVIAVIPPFGGNSSQMGVIVEVIWHFPEFPGIICGLLPGVTQ